MIVEYMFFKWFLFFLIYNKYVKLYGIGENFLDELYFLVNNVVMCIVVVVCVKLKKVNL